MSNISSAAIARLGSASAMRFLLLGVLIISIVAGCSDSSDKAPPDDSPYASKDLWLCRPDIKNDHCDMADLSTTEIQPDRTMVVLDELAPDPDAEVDCFYVYPTRNYDPEPGNTETLFPHPEELIEVVQGQAAHYRGVCRIFAPLYHQMSLVTYTAYWPDWEETEIFQKAYDDVVEAFEYYMRVYNGGRGFVLIGQSQGSHMLTNLLEDRFDDDAWLRQQLVSAVLMGPTNRVQVLEGEVTGGSFSDIPLCTSSRQTGCVIAFDANAAGVSTWPGLSVVYSPPSARACVNPAAIGGGSGTLSSFEFPRSSPLLGPYFPEGVETEWVSYPQVYTSRCANADESHVLLVDVASDYTGEVLLYPEEIQDIHVARGSNANLHGAEQDIFHTDLVRIVEQQIASWLN